MKAPRYRSRRDFLIAGLSVAVAPYLAPADDKRAGEHVPGLLDHFILGCDDLERGIHYVEQHTGVRAAFGGVHPGRGTRNALLSLGERRYLEIMSPDPEQKIEPQIARLRELSQPRIVGWAAHRDDLESFAAELRERKIEFEGPRPGSRQRPDGKVLHWKTLTLKDDHDGLLPFFIEWSADSIHPSIDAPKGCSLERFEAVAPASRKLTQVASEIGLDIYIGTSDKPLLKATIHGPKGELAATS